MGKAFHILMCGEYLTKFWSFSTICDFLTLLILKKTQVKLPDDRHVEEFIQISTLNSNNAFNSHTEAVQVYVVVNQCFVTRETS